MTDRIISSCERREQQERWAFRRRGQWMAFVIALFFGGATAVLIERGRNAQLLVFAVAAVTPIIGAFLGCILRAMQSKVLKSLDVTEHED